jgi:amino acid transporter
VGGGFYALVGKVAGESGMAAPISFLTAAVVAAFSALSFGELSARYPVSAGESHYVHQAFGRHWLSICVGWLVIATGIVSAAMLANAFVGFLQDVIAIPSFAGVVLMVVVLGAVAIWGIRESAALAVAITFIEVGGLIFVVFAGRFHLATLPERWHELVPAVGWSPWPGILVGAFLAFYSLIGFEDMVNVAEEVRNPRRNLPRAILIALGITTILYVSVTTVAVLAIPPASLAESRTPLAAVLRQSGYESTLAMSVISMLAGINGALVQIIMASRIVYGMARKEMAPSYFESVATSTRTPVRATVLIIGLVLVFALWLPLLALARLTSAIILIVFAMVNLSLIRIKRQAPPVAADIPTWPIWVPAAGFVLSLAFVGVQLWASLSSLVTPK